MTIEYKNMHIQVEYREGVADACFDMNKLSQTNLTEISKAKSEIETENSRHNKVADYMLTFHFEENRIVFKPTRKDDLEFIRGAHAQALSEDQQKLIFAYAP